MQLTNIFIKYKILTASITEVLHCSPLQGRSLQGFCWTKWNSTVQWVWLQNQQEHNRHSVCSPATAGEVSEAKHVVLVDLMTAFDTVSTRGMWQNEIIIIFSLIPPFCFGTLQITFSMFHQFFFFFFIST